MNKEQIIRKFFQNEDDAISYVRNRLLGDFDKAPPPTSDRFIEEFPTDVLQHLMLSKDLEDKAVFWNACFHLFKEWRDPRKADGNSAAGLSELVYMIRQFSRHHEEKFSEEKERWQEELKNPEHLRVDTYIEQEKNMVYTQNLSLVHIWNLWPKTEWLKLYENILKASEVNNEAQFELMLIAAQHLDWDATKTRQLFQWTLARDHLPKTFYNEFFFHRLYLCRNHLNNTDIEEQKNCQTRLVDDILKTHGCLFETLPREQKKALGQALLEASKLFDLKSFKCLDERKRFLLERELDDLTQPPSENEVSIHKFRTETSTGSKYMSNQYAGGEQLVAT